MKVLIVVGLFLVLSFVLMSCTSKRPEHLGVKDGKLAQVPSSPNAVSSFAPASDEEHYISPLALKMSVSDTKSNLKGILAKWSRVKLITETENYLHYECTSLIFRFVDDLEIYLDEESELIHFRSASRVGHSDFGVNRKRVERLKAEL